MIYFIGAGPGAADLITVKGKELLEKADLIIYAGSLVNPELLNYAKPECIIMDSAKMTLEEVIAAMVPAAQAGKLVVRLHTGDPSVYGAHREQIDLLRSYNLDFEIVPGVSSFCAAAACCICWVIACTLAADCSGVIGWIGMPSRNVATPSTTTCSPGFRPDVTTYCLPLSSGNTVISVFFTFELSPST